MVLVVLRSRPAAVGLAAEIFEAASAAKVFQHQRHALERVYPAPAVHHLGRKPSTGKGDDEVPTRVAVTARMETPGLVVLADLWFEGWKVKLNGEPAPILRTNYALRGVAVPAGESTLVFSYEPAGFATGVRLMALALVVLVTWTLALICLARRATPAE